ncbi:MAG: ATP-binding protein, partial [Candidatus Dormibacteraceae bacterium]
IDLEAALQSGEKRFEPGVLASANRNLLYVDEVNLLDDHIVDVLLDAAAMGVNVVEREGVSVSHPASFILVGTMNPEEGELRPQLLDRFGLCVDVGGIDQLEQRVEVIRKRTEWEENPARLMAEHSATEDQLRRQIAEGMSSYPGVQISASILRLIAQISLALEVEGHRADLVCARAAQVQAAGRGRSEVTPEEVGEIAELVYAHRVSRVPFARSSPKISEVISRLINEAP